MRLCKGFIEYEINVNFNVLKLAPKLCFISITATLEIRTINQNIRGVNFYKVS